MVRCGNLVPHHPKCLLLHRTDTLTRRTRWTDGKFPHNPRRIETHLRKEKYVLFSATKPVGNDDTIDACHSVSARLPAFSVRDNASFALIPPEHGPVERVPRRDEIFFVVDPFRAIRTLAGFVLFHHPQKHRLNVWGKTRTLNCRLTCSRVRICAGVYPVKCAEDNEEEP